MQADLAQLRNFLESAPDAMLVVGPRGEILLANARADELFASPDGALIGLCVDDLVPPSMREGHLEHRAAYNAAPTIRPMGAELELSAQRRDRTEFPVEISLSPLPGSEERLVLAAVRDLTVRKAAEQRLMDARMEIERREARERQALEINDGIVQGLAVADYHLQTGDHESARQALQATLHAARDIITGLLGDENELQPGDLRRSGAAKIDLRG